ncbi:hypothetical protein IWQ60_003659 [Tieghemiomyces parasiticus]|uniref:VPS9 domain-containing protein n=1 Tax=Tieghemiomyces parasiticus TaxID=78921 RepID=A0A9W8DUL7_9FUNG|nr:hypothetical protein IWQ60_003659 [Tieghemiomyces parasiticus]
MAAAFDRASTVRATSSLGLDSTPPSPAEGRTSARRTYSNNSMVATVSHPLGSPRSATAALLASDDEAMATATLLKTTPPRENTPPPPPLPQRRGQVSLSAAPTVTATPFQHAELAALYERSLAGYPTLQAHPDPWAAVLRDVDNFLVGFIRWAASTFSGSSPPRRGTGSPDRGPSTPRSSLELDPEIVAEHYQQFLGDVHLALEQAYTPIVSESEDVETLAIAWLSEIEDVCTTLAYPHTFSPRFEGLARNDYWQDEATASRIAALNMADLQLSHLGVDLTQSAYYAPAYQFDPADLARHPATATGHGSVPAPTCPVDQPLSYTAFIQEALRQASLYLQLMDKQRSVIQKVECIVAAHQVLTKAAQATPLPAPSTSDADPGTDRLATPVGGALTADDLLPLLIYTVIRYNPPRLVSNLHYIQHYLYQPRQSSGIPAYCLTTLAAAVSFLESIDLPALGLDTHRFDADLTTSASSPASTQSDPPAAVSVLAFNSSPSATGDRTRPATQVTSDSLPQGVIAGAIQAVRRGLPNAWSGAVAAAVAALPQAAASASAGRTPVTNTDILNFSFSPAISRRTTKADDHEGEVGDVGAKELQPLDSAVINPYQPLPEAAQVQDPSSSSSWIPSQLRPASFMTTGMSPTATAATPTLTTTGQGTVWSDPPTSDVDTSTTAPNSASYLTNHPLTNRFGKEIRDVTGGGIKAISGVYGMVFSRFRGGSDSHGSLPSEQALLDPPIQTTKPHHGSPMLVPSPSSPPMSATRLGFAPPVSPLSSGTTMSGADKELPRAQLVRRQTEPPRRTSPKHRSSALTAMTAAVPDQSSAELPRRTGHRTTTAVTSGGSSGRGSQNLPERDEQLAAGTLAALPPVDPFFASCHIDEVAVPQVAILLAEYQRLAAAIEALKRT